MLWIVVAIPFSIAAQHPKNKKESVARMYTPEERMRYTGAFLDAMLKELQGYGDEALVAYEKLVESDPALHAARYRIARLYYERKEYVAAAAAIQKALLYDPSNVWYWRL
ncbi:MAG: hypothetical protein RMM53_13960, partial [Bacteroidia bacterium]|nr:hypothetical protein [Bacteroidia bacterium]